MVFSPSCPADTQHSDPERPVKRPCLIACALWIAAVASGLFAMARYELTPAQAPPATDRWPEALPIDLSPSGHTVVFFAHPRCPCTAATADLLAAMSLRSARVYVLFTVPSAAGGEWTASALWSRAAAIPGAAVSADPDGAVAASFGVTTSGHVMVFDPSGRRLFSGGLTSGRGMACASRAGESVAAMLAGGAPAADAAPVYGCRLVLADEACGACPPPESNL
jgi:hypothetical protein